MGKGLGPESGAGSARLRVIELCYRDDSGLLCVRMRAFSHRVVRYAVARKAVALDLSELEELHRFCPHELGRVRSTVVCTQNYGVRLHFMGFSSRPIMSSGWERRGE